MIRNAGPEVVSLLRRVATVDDEGRLYHEDTATRTSLCRFSVVKAAPATAGAERAQADRATVVVDHDALGPVAAGQVVVLDRIAEEVAGAWTVEAVEWGRIALCLKLVRFRL